MRALPETEISKAIIDSYHRRLRESVCNDVVIVGAGPAGLLAAYRLAQGGCRVSVLEKRLAPGGGIWGGGMAMSDAVVQEEVVPILEELAVRHRDAGGGLYVVDAVELASCLCYRALQAGAEVFNLTTVEDVRVQEKRVTGVVINRTMIGGALPVDPITLGSKAVVDATGHEATVVATLKKRRLMQEPEAEPFLGEGPMDATVGEAFVAENASEVYPGLWVAGMSVCATLGGPRMGPIFGGMLLSGERVAGLIGERLGVAAPA